MVTVREALQFGGLQGSRLVAGEEGLDRAVRSVDIMEVPDADAWFRPHQFIVTCAYAMRDDPAALVRVVRALSRSEAAGLAVKSSRFLGAMPAAVIEAADQESLPLIDIPGDVPFVEITHPLLAKILNEQMRELQFQADVHQRFARLALDKGGLESVCAALWEVLGCPIHVLDGSARVLAGCPGKVVNQVERTGVKFKGRVLEIARDALTGTEGWRGGYGLKDGVLWVGIESKGCRLGLLAVDVSDKESLSTTEFKAVKEAAVICGLEILRVNALKDTEWRLRGDFLERILKSEPGPSEEAGAHVLGIDFARLYVVIAARAFRLKSRGHDLDSSLMRQLVAALREESDGAGIQAAVCGCGENVVAIWAGDTLETTRKLTIDLPDRLVKRIGDGEIAQVRVSLGVSGLRAGMTQVALAHREAVRALNTEMAAQDPGGIRYYGEVTPFSLLGEVSRETLLQYWKSQIGPLVGKEGRHLADTLEAFLQSSGEAKSAAKRLYIHRNTLTYRLKKTASLLGCDLRDSEVQFRLRLAFLARSILDKEVPPDG